MGQFFVFTPPYQEIGKKNPDMRLDAYRDEYFCSAFITKIT